MGEDLVPVEQIAMELVGEKTDIPINVFKGFVDIVAGEAIARAVLEHQLHQTVYTQTLTDLDVKALDTLDFDPDEFLLEVGARKSPDLSRQFQILSC
ncbi:hypothetical protein [Nostoc sp. CHAB 5715]|uniref:hypothetical protein n=1 Tax=Nostoc sp. CHAB 5715 TaxID=2780400 RepID=UPI001E2A028D|nr:hypothetical protein [Nostoc sp. CHAB 5715]MCC5623550.1 hypothetical protein [Nostoc sp. CHAB 5715]